MGRNPNMNTEQRSGEKPRFVWGVFKKGEKKKEKRERRKEREKKGNKTH